MTVADAASVATTHRIARFIDALDAGLVEGVRDVVPSYTTILLFYDDVITTVQRLTGTLEGLWITDADAPGTPRTDAVIIPVVYGDECGEDLREVATHHGVTTDEVIARHTAGTYTVGALGFSPGFAYLLGLDPALATPRRATPRIRVPGGSVGIGGAQTGIYALPSPGGWNLIGRTPMRLFRPERHPPVPFALGDTVRFERIAAWEEARAPEMPGDDRQDGVLEILAPGLQTTVQDLGRVGYGRYGFAPNGAADRASLMLANRAVGNPDDAAGLEMTLSGPTIRFHRRLSIAVAGADLGARLNGLPLAIGRAQSVMPGDELAFGTVSGVGARAYLAVGGGIDVPLVLGSRSTDLTAGIGGHRGRPLRAGDRLPVGDARRSDAAAPISPTPLGSNAPFEVVPGPQADRFDEETWHRLLGDWFTVSSSSDRMALRLEGPPLSPMDSADIISEGIVTGAIQVTGEGQPIVMLPGHATIGGYTKIASVVEGDLDRLGQLRPGDRVRFISRYRTN